MMAGDQSTTQSLTNSSTNKTDSISSKMASSTFKSMGNLIKLLPSGTVFMYQFLNPLLTNCGNCSSLNKFLTGALLILCGLSCSLSIFTDSIVENNKVYYGLATRKGMWLFAGSTSTDLSKYKLKFADFVHAALSLVIFASVALLNSNTILCYYSSLESEHKTTLMALPVVVGSIASFVFVVFPCTRHGIGYPHSNTSDESSA